MVLHHVAQRAGSVVVTGALLQAHGFGHGDLHVVHVVGIPQRLEQDVGEAQRHQVLHRLLAQVVVDAEDLAFRERAADRVIDHRGTGGVLADRFLDHHPRLAHIQAVRLQPVADVDKQAGAGGQVEHTDAVAVGLQFVGKLLPAFVLGRIKCVIAQLLQEWHQLGLQRGIVVHHRRQGIADLGAVVVVGLLVAGHADDATVLGNLAIGIAAEQSRQQLAQRQVASATKDDKVKGLNGDGLGGHVRRAAFNSGRNEKYHRNTI